MKRTEKSCALRKHRSRRACCEDTQNISKRTRRGYTLSGLCRLEQDVGMAVSIPGSKLEQRAKNYAFASYVRLQDSFRRSKCLLSTFPVLVHHALKINLCAFCCMQDSLIALTLTKHLQILRSRTRVVCLPLQAHHYFKIGLRIICFMQILNRPSHQNILPNPAPDLSNSGPDTAYLPPRLPLRHSRPRRGRSWKRGALLCKPVRWQSDGKAHRSFARSLT